jgi:uncharacterized protein (DUF2384 family)
MKVAEIEKLKDIPSKIDTNKILQLVKSSKLHNLVYFGLLKSITNEDDKGLSDWLNISEKTFRSHKTTEKTAKPQLIEHAILLISLFKHGVEIFGNSEQFKKWLKTENFYFDKGAPLKYIDTSSGIKFIDDRLTGIEYGDNA